jgi:hypothetical protein
MASDADSEIGVVAFESKYMGMWFKLTYPLHGFFSWQIS